MPGSAAGASASAKAARAARAARAAGASHTPLAPLAAVAAARTVLLQLESAQRDLAVGDVEAATEAVAAVTAFASLVARRAVATLSPDGTKAPRCAGAARSSHPLFAYPRFAAVATITAGAARAAAPAAPARGQLRTIQGWTAGTADTADDFVVGEVSVAQSNHAVRDVEAAAVRVAARAAFAAVAEPERLRRPQTIPTVSTG
jgi:hypothetical protein